MLGRGGARIAAGSSPLRGKTYEQLLAPALRMQSQYTPQIRDKVDTLDASRIMSLLRGG